MIIQVEGLETPLNWGDWIRHKESKYEDSRRGEGWINLEFKNGGKAAVSYPSIQKPLRPREGEHKVAWSSRKYIDLNETWYSIRLALR